MYEWQSLAMGNVVVGFREVLKQIWESWKDYRMLDIIWKCIGKFTLPSFVYASATYIHKEWNTMDDDDKQEAINDFLSKTYRCCNKGFEYEETNDVIHITNIQWNEEE